MGIRNYFHLSKITISTLLLWLTGVTAVFSQDYLFDAQVINIKDGLPHRMTYNIVQDKEGFIWVSTVGGISRYDGYNFKNYSYNALNIVETSPSFLAVDRNNNLWYCEAFGSNDLLHSGVIDARKDIIYSMESFSKGRFSSKDLLYIGNSKVRTDEILIAARSGTLYKYNDTFEEIYRFPRPISDYIKIEAIAEGGYWIVYDRNVMKVKNGELVETFQFESLVRRIIMQSPDLVIELFPTPIVSYGKPKSIYWKLEKDVPVPFSIKNHAGQQTTWLFRPHKNYFCYAYGNKLIIEYKNSDTTYTFDHFKPNELKYHNALLDRQNILWITSNNGLLKITLRKNPFKVLQPGNSTRGIFKDDGKLWTGGHQRNIVEELTTGIKEDFWAMYYNESVTSFYKDQKGHLWMGTTTHELLEYDPGTEKYTTHHGVEGDGAFYLFFQNPVTGHCFIGSANGVLRFDEKTKKISPFSLPIASANLNIRQFYQNKQEIWIISNKGIFLMDAEKETILKHYTTADGLPHNNINHVYEDKHGIFWLGTKGQGLVRWDRSVNSFQQYTRKNGLSNNNIYAVYEDDYETLWLPSDYGLIAFDKNTFTTKVYLPKNGIAHEEFNTYSHFKDEDGTLYFGGLNGISMFHPRNLRKEATTILPLYVNSVQVLEKGEEKFTDKTAAFLKTGNINLKPDDQILEIELTLLDYENSDENQYAYKLSDKQEQWVYTSENKISIISPPYGHYKLIIKAMGASGSSSDNTLTIPVYKPLPFYMQWWFLLILIVIITVSVIMAFRWRLQRLKKDRKRLEEEVRKRTWQIEQDKKTIEQDKQTIEAQAEELKILDKAKTRFFSNITHEFRTPLTLILGPIEQIMRGGDISRSIKSKMQSVAHNTNHLLGLINQLLDVSKLEEGQMQVKISTADVVAFTGKLVQGFQPLVREKEQRLVFTSTLKNWKTHFDIGKFNKIVYNLLSNAVKYTPEKGFITLSLSKRKGSDNESINIQIKDTGIGIPVEVVPHIFNRFYQVDDSLTRKGTGTGIGLALVKELVELQNGEITVKSKPGTGSVFTVIIPVLPPPLHPDASYEAPQPIVPLTVAKNKTVPGEKPKNNVLEENKLELLIIEDNKQMRTYIRSCIDASRYHISEAVDGEEGIIKAQKIVPDLIISDIMMPKKDGFQVTHAIRNHNATSHIPLILLTAKASDESRLQGISRGADAYLTKPFSPQELNLRIRKLIELRQLLQQRYQQYWPPEINPVFQKEDEFISKLTDYIKKNLTHPNLSGERISSKFAMSRAQFYRKLKALKNTNPGDFIRSIRLNMALQLLKEKQLNITEIAYESGFSSVHHFSRTFKKAYGKAPSEFLTNNSILPEFD